MQEESSKLSEENPPAAEAPQPVPETPNESSLDHEPQEKEIDLNTIFPDAETDLNALFPDTDVKLLLKKISKDKKDLHALKDRFLQENETSDDAEEQ